MKAYQFLLHTINRTISSTDILLGCNLATYAEQHKHSIRILKGKFKSDLYFVSKDKEALPQRPDVIEKYFETMLYFWEIEM